MSLRESDETGCSVETVATHYRIRESTIRCILGVGDLAAGEFAIQWKAFIVMYILAIS
jgi:hypothetical protein